ncbi:UNVERIFIED_ORG: ubiquinone/menaquinone biosynthesis C-methylase UbiE/glycosyltransferase involved in cell wall biosynthesis/TolA-binding protein [Paraburkholderia sediminicola]|nr:ubiquinone/menaquinone biosynthesis C-methylase UbiE/glycosyltransferase involved in cell wall biosynthesis/TolA-binding protein [Paraburkholderia sediminicola]
MPEDMVGEIEFEHYHRYHAVSELVAGLDVLDIASGEGYGSALMSGVAQTVTGVDISADAVAFAQRKYAGDRPNLKYLQGNCAAIPLGDASVDAVVSFETIEHHDQHEEMMAEIKRVLRPNGLLIISSPDKREYSDVPGYSNPYHIKELYKDEFESLLLRSFKHCRLYGQRVYRGSTIFPLSASTVDAGNIRNYLLDGSHTEISNGAVEPLYFLAVVSDMASLPSYPTGIFTSRNEEGRITQLGNTIQEQSEQLNALHGHIHHMNQQQESKDAELASLRSQLEHEQAQNKGVLAELDAANNALADANAARAAMLRSTSWRVTSPLRVSKMLSSTLVSRLRSKGAASRSPGQATAGAAPSAPSTSDTRDSAIQRMAQVARKLGDAGSALKFDGAYYLKCNPDVAAAGVDPYEHYLSSGRREGRSGTPPTLIVKEYAGKLPRDRRTVLVVSHDASRTGAPILAWNICKELRLRGFNVVALLLGPGGIASFFNGDACDVLIGPYKVNVRNPIAMGVLVPQICERYQIDFALVNSIESRSVLEALAENFVPSVLMIHEFSAYTRPKDAFGSALRWAGRVVFPAKLVQDNAITNETKVAVALSEVVPQGKSEIPAIAGGAGAVSKSRTEFVRAAGLNARERRPFLVLGAGSVQYRKGVDLFIATAAELKRLDPAADIVMAWVGHGYNPETDLQYSTYIREQIERAELGNRFAMVGELEDMEPVYALSDLFFLSSRLDPLPNVAIDSMVHGKPALCFDRATGAAEWLQSDEATAQCVLPFLDVTAVARRILDLYRSPDQLAALSNSVRRFAEHRFDNGSYVAKLVELGEDLSSATQQEQKDCDSLAGTADFVEDFFRAPECASQTRAEAIRLFVRSWRSGTATRKPAPGFNPSLYAQHHNIGVENPFAHFIRAGRPAGAWMQRLINVAAPDVGAGPAPKCALHIHAFYPDLVPDILARVGKNELECDIFLSVPSENAADALRATLPVFNKGRIEIEVVPNRGRDIGPFLTQFSSRFEQYEVVGHVHTKKSLDLKSPAFVENWVQFLLENLIGGRHASADAILGRFGAEPDLGIVYADDPHLQGWSENWPFAEPLVRRIGLATLPDGDFSFPVGTMFWARPRALKPMFDLGLGWTDYPEEPLPYDGSILHAIERLLPLVAQAQGFSPAVTFVPGLTR